MISGFNSGIKIIHDIHMVERGKPYEAQRTWRERLLTRPWKPWKATKTVTPMVPMQAVYTMGDMLVMHPETAKKLIDEIKNHV